MTASTGPATKEEEQEILRLLQAGFTNRRICELVGRSHHVVRRVRAENGIAPGPVGRRANSQVKVIEEPPEEPEESGTGEVRPWIPPPGYDMYAERRLQGQWLAMCAAAHGVELVNLRHAVCRVLGLKPGATDLQLEAAVVADRRLAEDLAGRYLTARATLR